MNRAFLIVVIPSALIFVGYCVVLGSLGAALPWRELGIALAVILGAAAWRILKKKEAK